MQQDDQAPAGKAPGAPKKPDVALVCAAVALAGLVAAVLAWGNIKPRPFADVSQIDWFTGYVEYVVDRGIMGPYDSGRNEFGPHDAITRAAVATVAWRIAADANADEEPRPLDEPPCPDVPADAWYAQAVSWCLDNDVMAPVGDGELFEPGGQVTLEELTDVFFRLAQACGAAEGTELYLDYPGVDEISPFAQQSFGWCRHEGLVLGKFEEGRTTWTPRDPATRAQCAKFAAILCEDVLEDAESRP